MTKKNKPSHKGKGLNSSTELIGKNSNKLLRRSFKESKELEFINKSLPLLEKKKSYIEDNLKKNIGDLTELSKDLAYIVKEIKEAEDRWIELSELLP